MTDAYKNPADDVDSFYSQIESSVVAVLDALAPCKTRRKRRGKRSSRWLSDAAVAAKRTRRLERRWKRTVADSDRVAYRTACHTANDEINASRSAYYQQQFTEAAASQTATWRLAKDLLHSDDPPPAVSSPDASKLCNDFCSFFADKIEKIAVTVSSCLFAIPAYHRRSKDRQIPCPLDELSNVTIDKSYKADTFEACQVVAR